MATASLSMGQKAHPPNPPMDGHTPTSQRSPLQFGFLASHVHTSFRLHLTTCHRSRAFCGLGAVTHATVLVACISQGPHTPFLSSHVSPSLGTSGCNGSAILSAQTHSALVATCHVLLQTRGQDSNVRRACQGSTWAFQLFCR